ncbi:hypothetical protein KAR91_68465 [Candidatus Pacearchaeota archaeon]|nr:hypothetical protein [Candidatus Pacearchaeota archaeon]
MSTLRPPSSEVVKPGADTSEFKALNDLGLESKYIKWLSVFFTLFGTLAPLFLESINSGSIAAIVITAILALAVKFGFKSHAVGKYAMGRSIVKAGSLNPPRES